MASLFFAGGLSEPLTRVQTARRLGVSGGWARCLVADGRLLCLAAPLGRLILRAAGELLAGEPEHAVSATGAPR